MSRPDRSLTTRRRGTRAKLRWVCALGWTLLCAGGAPAQPVALRDLRAKYDAALAAIAAGQRQSIGQLARQYEDMLSRSERSAQAAANLDAAIAIRDEKKRFAADRTVPGVSPDACHPDVRALHDRYRAAVADVGRQRSTEFVRVTDAYTNQLAALRVSLTQAGRLDEAVAARTESDFAISAGEYRAALDAVRSAATPATTKPPDPAAGARGKTLRAVKVIDPRGSMTDTWTTVPLLVKPGDIVTVKAEGAWQAPQQGISCGPEGVGAAGPYAYWRTMGLGNRQTAEAPPGALILRAGSRGAVRYIGNALTFTNDANGTLAFDMNLKTDRKERMKCTGTVKVNVEVLRPGGQAE